MKSKDVIRIENHSSRNSFTIRWEVTQLCNYSCDFCIQGDKENHARKARGEREETRCKIAEHIVSIIEDQSECAAVRVLFIGGEVTVLKDFPDILSHIAASSHKGDIQFQITTNFSKSTAYYCNLFDIVNKYDRASGIGTRSLSLLTSFYEAYMTSEEFFGKLRAVYDYVETHCRRPEPRREQPAACERGDGHKTPTELLQLGSTSTTSSSVTAGWPMLSDRDYRNLEKIRLDFEGTHLTIAPILIRQYKTDISNEVKAEILGEEEGGDVQVAFRTGEEKTFRSIRSLGLYLGGDGRFCPRGFMCDAGVNYVSISPLGHARRCPALFDDAAMELGDLLDGSYQKLDGPRECPSDHCSCNVFGLIEQIGS